MRLCSARSRDSFDALEETTLWTFFVGGILTGKERLTTAKGKKCVEEREASGVVSSWFGGKSSEKIDEPQPMNGASSGAFWMPAYPA